MECSKGMAPFVILAPALVILASALVILAPALVILAPALTGRAGRTGRSAACSWQARQSRSPESGPSPAWRWCVPAPRCGPLWYSPRPGPSAKKILKKDD